MMLGEISKQAVGAVTGPEHLQDPALAIPPGSTAVWALSAECTEMR